MLTSEHRHRIDEIKKLLTATGCKESTFVTVELLFYEALEIARTYRDNPGTNLLLSQLKDVQAKQYVRTQELFQKSAQREKVIRQFMAAFKSAISIPAKKSTAIG